MSDHLTLYELTEMQRQVLDGMMVVDAETGEVYDLMNADDLGERFEEKVEALACYLKELDAWAEACRNEEKKMAARRRVVEARADHFRRYMLACLNEAGERKVDTPKACVTTRRSKAVEVYDEKELPDDYLRVKTTVEIDRKAITEAIRSGLVVPGATLVDRTSLIVK